ncbi:MAG: Spy/CpxP family protein refolding chaperone [Aquabacterium sp.]|uniref:Spy/CpxP family protein refolding chaperone n=1 Tax=Aquabacterium sp. TaxID=1872578 RepID=UPI001DDB6939|nr:Spy/CpxP family protein refolding chaperone [Aquabacterium sp.]MBT9609921.1 Spy/CpxP family protein refolding chaperone [Aquabacterium sp.]
MTHLPTPATSAARHTGPRTLRTTVIASALALAAIALSLGAGAPAFAADKAGDTSAATAASASASAPASAPRMAPGMRAGLSHGMSHGMSRGGHGEHGGMGMGMMPFGRHLDRLLTEVKASDAQRQQIKQLTDKARADVQALHEQGKGLHERTRALWTAPKLDAAEAEKLRQQMLAQHDQVSKRMTQAMLDVGNVLTPEQRAKAAELIKARRERHAKPGMDR